MPIESVQSRLNRALDDAVELADLGGRHLPGIAIARTIYTAEPELIEELKEAWMLEKLAWHINRKRGDRWRRKSPQMELPGFENMPSMIFLRNGQRPKLEYATTSDIEDHVKLLRTRFHDSPRVKKMEAVLELMRRHTSQNRGITWGEVKRKELERRDFDRLVGS